MKKEFFLIVLLSILYFIFGKLRIESLINAEIVSSVIFPSEGIALAFVLYFGRKVALGVFFGQLLLALSNGIGIVPSVLISLVNMSEAILGYYLFKKFKLDIKLSSFRDLIGFVLIVVGVLQPYSAVISNFILNFFGYLPDYDLMHSIYSWWLGNLMGQIIYTPAVISFIMNYNKIKIAEFLFVGIIYTLMISFLILAFDLKSSLFLLLVSLPIILIEIYVRNISYGMFIIILFSFALLFISYEGYGPFVSNKMILVNDYNLYILSLALIILIINVIFEKQKNFQKILENAVQEAIEKNKEQQLLLLQQNKLAQMGEMIGMIAHQWRQPLNNLALLQQMLVNKYKEGKLNDYFIEYFEKNAKQQINLMTTTIDDFRNFFKPKENKKKFILNHTIKKILNMVKDVFLQKGITIEYKQTGEFECFGYSNSLAHAILNIINNAKDALIENGIENKKIKITLYKDQKQNVIIEIADNAGGIPKNIIDRIFEPYFSTKNEKNGTGLGLYMTKMIIEQHWDSKIMVENKNDGAYFKIILNKKICKLKGQNE